MRDLSHTLLKAGFEIWVVSASIRWIVEVGVKDFGIQHDHVIGSSVVVESGVLTEKIENMVPYRGAKAKLIEKIIGVKPLLAGGNTYWDKEMLGTARELVLTINSEKKGTLNYDSEQRLRSLAEANRWLIQGF